jgi:hypothetical protein
MSSIPPPAPTGGFSGGGSGSAFGSFRRKEQPPLFPPDHKNGKEKDDAQKDEEMQERPGPALGEHTGMHRSGGSEQMSTFIKILDEIQTTTLQGDALLFFLQHEIVNIQNNPFSPTQLSDEEHKALLKQVLFQWNRERSDEDIKVAGKIMLWQSIQCCSFSEEVIDEMEKLFNPA